MICEEHMELMQRDIDNDLSSFEKGRLDQHLKQCSECRSLYSRLQILSNNLESLPEVHPPFSIVDSILPALAEMGRQDTAAHETVPLKAKRPTFWTRSRVAAGAVAASMLIGVYVVNDYVIPKSKGNYVSDIAVTADKKSDAVSNNNETALAKDEKSDVGITAEEAQAEPMAKGPSVGMSAFTSEADKRDAVPKKSVNNIAPEDPPALAAADVASPPTDAASPHADGDASSEQVQEQPPTEQPVEKAAIAGALGMDNQSKYGLTAEPARNDKPAFASPSNAYRAVIDESVLIIENSEGVEKFRSHSLPGAYRLHLVWENDAVLNYEIYEVNDENEQDSQGALIEAWKISLDEKTNSFSEVQLNTTVNPSK